MCFFYGIYLFFDCVGLIRLPKKVKIQDDIQAVRMPISCDATENIDVMAMGFGGTDRNSSYSPQLYFVTLKTLPLKVCRKALPVILFRTSVICASNEARAQSIFDGDSGGPLVRSDGTLIGVSSFTQGSKFIAKIDSFETNYMLCYNLN